MFINVIVLYQEKKTKKEETTFEKKSKNPGFEGIKSSEKKKVVLRSFNKTLIYFAFLLEKENQ